MSSAGNALPEARRRPVDIARVLANARLFNPAREAAMVDDLDTVVQRLLEQLEASDADYVVAGGLALLHYVAGRNTEILELIVPLQHAERVDGLVIADRDADFAQASFDGLAVDLLLTSNVLFEQVRRRHTASMYYLGHRVPVVTPAGLVALKLYALPSLYRQQALDKVQLYETDIAMLLQAEAIDVERVFGELERVLAPGDVQELRAVCGEIAARLARGDRFGAS